MLQQMSPAERRLYEASRRILRTFNTDFRGVTDVIVDSFTRGVNRADQILQRPDVLRSAQRLANQLARQMNRVFDSFTSPRQLRQFERITKDSRENLEPIADIAIDIGHALRLQVCQRGH